MPINLQGVNILCGGTGLEALRLLPAHKPFDDNVCGFLNRLSSKLLENASCRTYPDIITFAFFCRKANIEKLRAGYGNRLESRLGRGVNFHIAPGNVPINFAYSLVAGLLAGNVCIVKAASKPYQQTSIVAGEMADVLKDYPELSDYITIITYDRANNHPTKYFSSLCDVRVIWGGDETISQIRRYPIPARSFDVTFADRYSVAVIGAEAINNANSLDNLARDFYNDTYLYDQNACSSPRLVYWIGDKSSVDMAKKKFWSAVHSYVAGRYEIEPALAVGKLSTSLRCAIDFDNVYIEPMPDNLINRIRLSPLSRVLAEYRCAGGSFLEYASVSIDDLAGIVTEKLQTIGCYGMKTDELRQWALQSGLRGVDRIVPIGKAADFSLIWDGWDLIEGLSRVIT